MCLFLESHILKAKFIKYGYIRRDKVEELSAIIAEIFRVPVTAILLSDKSFDGMGDVKEFVLNITTSNQSERKNLATTLPNFLSIFEKCSLYTRRIGPYSHTMTRDLIIQLKCFPLFDDFFFILNSTIIIVDKTIFATIDADSHPYLITTLHDFY